MPKDPSLNKILVIGSGPILIGQGCEFDYAGTQACQALHEEKCSVVLVNPNPATIMTDSSMAEATYIEPIHPHLLEQIIQKERPDALLPSMGGQTALNAVVELNRLGILKKYSVRVIGPSLDSIEQAENRGLFRASLQAAGLPCLPACFVTNLSQLNAPCPLPAIVRSSFTLSGYGVGLAKTKKDLFQLVQNSLSISPQGVLVEQSIEGWKEIELEVMKDQFDNCLVICGIENIDPMGIHTGDSITVTPIQTLTNTEYQRMRTMAFACMKAIHLTSGGCNVQFALSNTGTMLPIEINPRVSRSSALASKATGYPIAKIATKLALGYALPELQVNNRSAFFEPTLDYVVVKMPFFPFDKFPDEPTTLSPSMKAIGEVMGVGESFQSAYQNAQESLEGTVYEHPNTNYAPWFVQEISNKKNRIKPTNYHEIDPTAGELLTSTHALFPSCEKNWKKPPPPQKRKILLIGSGANRIGQGIEFDYCLVHALKAIKEMGYEAIIINCNPSTVSTDPEFSDRLYIEPITFPRVYEVYKHENPEGVLLQFGGQTPLRLARQLHEHRIPLLGMSYPSIETCENRALFRDFLHLHQLPQPKNGFFTSCEEALALAQTVGYPLILRPSYIIGGSSIQVIATQQDLITSLSSIGPISAPILMEEYLQEGLEVEVDALFDGTDVSICGIIEQFDPVGIHSGDSIASLFPLTISEKILHTLQDQTKQIGRSLNSTGLFNVQFCVREERVYVLEVNPRASRTIPLLAKTTNTPFVQIATRAILGKPFAFKEPSHSLFAIKVPCFPFNRFVKTKKQLGPSMYSTGEMLFLGTSLSEAFLKAKDSIDNALHNLSKHAFSFSSASFDTTGVYSIQKFHCDTKALSL